MTPPVRPPQPTPRVVQENVESVESSAGVASFSGQIQVSVEACTPTSDRLSSAQMNPALFEADWQFQRPKVSEKRRVSVRERRFSGFAFSVTDAFISEVLDDRDDIVVHSD